MLKDLISLKLPGFEEMDLASSRPEFQALNCLEPKKPEVDSNSTKRRKYKSRDSLTSKRVC
jgi:hypothetical protein